jgi:transposase-like protein
MLLQSHEECLVYLEQIRWAGNPCCPYCESTRATAYKNEHRYRCNSCFTSYSVTVGTLFHKTHIDLHIWFSAIYIVLNSSENVTIRQLAKHIGVNKNTASYMLARIHQAADMDSSLLQKIMEFSATKSEIMF